jgi:hypothetical protein
MILAPNGQPARHVLSGGNRPQTQNLFEAFEGAKYGGYRGWWFLPTLSSERQMPQFTRDQLARKNVWCYNNIGEMRALIDGLAIDEVDTAIWPKAMTSNPAFSKAVTNRFHEENKDARSFDLRGVDDCYSAQFTIRRSIRLVGDLFAQLVRPFPISSAGSRRASASSQAINASRARTKSCAMACASTLRPARRSRSILKTRKPTR